jgi:glycosyltransferase involved in cell wall biosynthesis
MPVYNSETYLNEAINSILNQSFIDFEFLIINDGSVDKSHEIIERFAKIDKRIRSIKHNVNIGIVDTLNEGLALAKGTYIARMDADDISLQDRLLTQVRFLQQSGFHIVGSKYQNIDSQGHSLGISHTITEPVLLKWNSFFKTPLAHPSVLFNKKSIIDLGGYKGCLHTEDYDLWIRAYMHGLSIGNVDEVLILYRRHSSSISSTNVNVQNNNTLSISKMFVKWYLSKISLKELNCLLKKPRICTQVLFDYYSYSNTWDRLFKRFCAKEIVSDDNIKNILKTKMTIVKYCLRAINVFL